MTFQCICGYTYVVPPPPLGNNSFYTDHIKNHKDNCQMVQEKESRNKSHHATINPQYYTIMGIHVDELYIKSLNECDLQYATKYNLPTSCGQCKRIFNYNNKRQSDYHFKIGNDKVGDDSKLVRCWDCKVQYIEESDKWEEIPSDVLYNY